MSPVIVVLQQDGVDFPPVDNRETQFWFVPAPPGAGGSDRGHRESRSVL